MKQIFQREAFGNFVSVQNANKPKMGMKTTQPVNPSLMMAPDSKMLKKEVKVSVVHTSDMDQKMIGSDHPVLG